MRFNLKLGIFLFFVWNFCLAGTFYKIQNFEPYATPNPEKIFWVPIEHDHPGDSVLVKVDDARTEPGITVEDNGTSTPNFVYYDASTKKELAGDLQGLFCFKSVAGLNLFVPQILLSRYDKTTLYACNKSDSKYYIVTINTAPIGGHLLVYSPSKTFEYFSPDPTSAPHPFVFVVVNHAPIKIDAEPQKKHPVKDVHASEFSAKLLQLKNNLTDLKKPLVSLNSKVDALRSSLVGGKKPQPKPKVPQGKQDGQGLAERIFAKAKAMIGEIPNASVELKDGAGSGLSFDIKTQSIVHMDYLRKHHYLKDFFLGDEIPSAENLAFEDVLANLSHYAGSSEKIKILARNVLRNEQENADYYAFYHAFMGGYFSILYEIYQFMYSWGMLSATQSIVLRFLLEDMDFDRDFANFRNEIKMKVKCKKTSERNREKCTYSPEGGGAVEKGQCVDQIDTFRNRLLSVNLALFGNKGNSLECSFDYFTSGKSVTTLCEGNIIDLLDEIMRKIQIKDETWIEKFHNKLHALIKKFYPKFVREGDSVYGVLLQIFVKKDCVNEVAYWALAGGYNIDEQYYKGDFVAIEPFTREISQLLDKYIKDPDGLNEVVKTYTHNIHMDEYNLSLDNLQARLWLKSPDLYDQAKTKVFRFSLVDKSVFDELHRELGELFEVLIKEFIRLKIAGKIKSAELPAAFKPLDKFIDKAIGHPDLLTKNWENKVYVNKIAIA